MGVIFEARDDRLNRSVALKVLRVGREEDRDIQRFLKEAQAAAKLQHDHVLPILGVLNTSDGRPVLVMPLVHGPTLRQKIAQERVLTPHLAAKIVGETARGLHAAHMQGLIHRDVKPSNILLDDNDGRAKLTDFGLVRETNQLTDTSDGKMLGTLEYMSQEQMTKPSTVDARADVYSLGATLYEALTGTPPFRGSPAEIIHQVVHDDPIPPKILVGSIPRDLETICLKALARDLTSRYPSAEEFAADLARWESGEPIHARPVSRLERVRKWIRRNPGPSVALVAGWVLIVGLIIATIWLRDALNRTSQAEALATTRREQAEEERERSEQVFNFFVRDLLLQADVTSLNQQGDPNITVRTLLDRASAEVNRSTTLAPKTELMLRHNIAAIYLNLRMANNAIPHFKRAYELAIEIHTENHPTTSAVENQYATALFQIGKQQEALERHERLLERNIAQFGPDHEITLTTRHNLSNELSEVGQLQRAIELQTQNYQYRLAKDGEIHPATADSANSLGITLNRANRPKEAKDILSKAVSTFEITRGKEHIKTMLARGNLAGVEFALKDYESAAANHEKVRDAFLAYFGPDNSYTLVARTNLAEAYFALGRTNQAIEMATALLQDSVRGMGTDHSITITVRSNLGSYLSLSGRHEEGLKLLAENAQLCENQLTAKHPKTIISWHNYANTLRTCGRNNDAIQIWTDRVIPAAKEIYGSGHPTTITLKKNCARTMNKVSRSADAIKFFEEIIAIQRTAKDSETALGDSLDEYGEILIRIKDYTKALPALQESFRLQTQRSPVPWEACRTQIRLGTALIHSGRVDDGTEQIHVAIARLKTEQKTVPSSWFEILTQEATAALRVAKKN
ncbi:MAG: tetratricopeptide repeat protein [Fimbriiglobus sp.]